MFRRYPGVSTRSAGVSRQANRTINAEDVLWADVIFVMEEKHRSRIQADFRDEMRHKDVHVLDIPDDYKFMDPELVELLVDAVEPIVGV